MVLFKTGDIKPPADYGITNGFMMAYLNAISYETEHSRRKRAAIKESVSPRYEEGNTYAMQPPNKSFLRVVVIQLAISIILQI